VVQKNKKGTLEHVAEKKRRGKNRCLSRSWGGGHFGRTEGAGIGGPNNGEGNGGRGE